MRVLFVQFLLLDSFSFAIIFVVVVAFIHFFLRALSWFYLIHNFKCHWIDSIREFFFCFDWIAMNKNDKMCCYRLFQHHKMYVHNIQLQSLTTYTHSHTQSLNISFHRWNSDNNVLLAWTTFKNSWDHRTWNHQRVYVTQYHHFELIKLYLKSLTQLNKKKIEHKNTKYLYENLKWTNKNKRQTIDSLMNQKEKQLKTEKKRGKIWSLISIEWNENKIFVYLLHKVATDDSIHYVPFSIFGWEQTLTWKCQSFQISLKCMLVASGFHCCWSNLTGWNSDIYNFRNEN